MSSINSNAASILNSATSSATQVSRDETGFASLTPEKFLELLVSQLQTQDPTEPVGNQEIMNQLAMMRDLQASIDLSKTLESITSNQQLSTAASFLGNSVVAEDAGGTEITGIVERAFVRDSDTYVSVRPEGAEEPTEVKLSKVTGVTQPTQSSGSAAA